MKSEDPYVIYISHKAAQFALCHENITYEDVLTRMNPKEVQEYVIIKEELIKIAKEEQDRQSKQSQRGMARHGY